MDKMMVYIGSGYVIKTPDFDFKKHSLRVSVDGRDARSRATARDAVGVVNTYRLNLQGLNVSHGADSTADAAFSGDGEYLLLQSEDALKALSFVRAAFASQ